MRRVLLVVAMLAPLLGADAPATRPAAPGAASAEVARQQIQKLQWLVGTWQGEGWSQLGPQRSESHGTERVQPRLDGTILMIEGRFRPKGAPTGPLVHEALGIMYYDEQAQALRRSTWLANGRRGIYPVEAPDDRTVIWSIPTPQGTMRYTVRRDDQGRWVEIGERIPPDGSAPMTFFEMTLERVADDAAGT